MVKTKQKVQKAVKTPADGNDQKISQNILIPIKSCQKTEKQPEQIIENL
jgi:hypothetical protein